MKVFMRKDVSAVGQVLIVFGMMLPSRFDEQRLTNSVGIFTS